MVQGKLQEALEVYQQDLAIAKALAEQESFFVFFSAPACTSSLLMTQNGNVFVQEDGPQHSTLKIPRHNDQITTDASNNCHLGYHSGNG
jgi:hypothetical protein